jgi:hypothetical protein
MSLGENLSFARLGWFISCLAHALRPWALILGRSAAGPHSSLIDPKMRFYATAMRLCPEDLL